jgi:hypothetical protein
MLEYGIDTVREALTGIDGALMIETLGYAAAALPFDYKLALGYLAVGIGTYCFFWFGYRHLTEPERTIRSNLLSSADKRFMLALEQAVTPCHVYPSVSVNSVLSARSLSPMRRKSALAKTAALRYDFLICDDSMRIIAAVDHRDKRLGKPRAVKRGLKVKRRASEQSGLPLITFDRKYDYSPDEINHHVSSVTTIPRIDKAAPLSGTEKQDSSKAIEAAPDRKIIPGAD